MKTLFNTTKRKIAFFTMLAICLFFAAVVFSLLITEDTPVPIADENFGAGTSVTISGIIVERTFDDLINKSCLVVNGTISEKSEAFQIESPRGSKSIHTDYTLTIDSTLRGTAAGNEIIVRVQGGTANGFTEDYENSPDFEIGKQYLLFLYQPARGGAFNLPGDYYYVLGLKQGVYETSTEDTFISQFGKPLSVTELQNALDAVQDVPVDLYYFRNEYITNQEKNLQTGFINEEEFAESMQNIDIYATIVG
jgi:hypothetical protein